MDGRISPQVSGHGIEIARVNLIHVVKPLISFNFFRTIPLQVKSSNAIVFFALSVRIPY